jgi:hypothetical protein
MEWREQLHVKQTLHRIYMAAAVYGCTPFMHKKYKYLQYKFYCMRFFKCFYILHLFSILNIDIFCKI